MKRIHLLAVPALLVLGASLAAAVLVRPPRIRALRRQRMKEWGRRTRAPTRSSQGDHDAN